MADDEGPADAFFRSIGKTGIESSRAKKNAITNIREAPERISAFTAASPAEKQNILPISRKPCVSVSARKSTKPTVTNSRAYM